MADEEEYSADEHSLPEDVEEEQQEQQSQQLEQQPELHEEQEQGGQAAVAAAAALGTPEHADQQPAPDTLKQPEAVNGSNGEHYADDEPVGASQDTLQHSEQSESQGSGLASSPSGSLVAKNEQRQTALQPPPNHVGPGLAPSTSNLQQQVLWPPAADSNPTAATQLQPSSAGAAPVPVSLEPRQVSSHTGLSTLPSARSFVSQRHSMHSTADDALLPQHTQQAGHAAVHVQPSLSRSNTIPEAASTHAAVADHLPQGDERLQQHPATAMVTEPMQSQTQGPGYLAPTQAMPNALSTDYSHASHQAVMLAFSPGSWFGIRSLPNALSPDFKQQLHQQYALHHGMQLQPGPPFLPPGGRLAACAPDQMPGWEQLLGGPGLQPVGRTHPYAGSFARFHYLPSEFDRYKLGEKFERLQGKLAQVTPVEFVVRSTPAAPKGAPAFCEFQHGFEPNPCAAQMRLDEENAARAGSLAGPFVMAGRAKPPASLRGRADDCMRALCKLLSYDWPTAFMQVFEDKTGAVVVCFDHTAAVLQGDLSAYMQQLAKNHWLTSEFRLTKDGNQWGLIDGDLVFYLLWPPWTRHRLVGPASPAVKKPTVASPRPVQQPEEEVSTEGVTSAEPSYSPRGLDMASMGALSRSAAAAASCNTPPLQSAAGRSGSAANPCSRGLVGTSLSGFSGLQAV